MYYPKSQIKENLYTNGTEYYLSTTGKSYTGYYYETSKGKKFTGKTSVGTGGVLLTTFSGNNVNLNKTTEDFEGSNPDIVQSAYVRNYNNKPITPRSVPNPIKSTPSPQDLAKGEYERYFVKRNNEFLYYEISSSDYNLLQKKSLDIAFNLYNSVKLIWSLRGQIISANKKTVELVEKRYRWFGFVNYFQNNFSTSQIPPNYLETKGGEFLLPNRTNYVGFFHQMKNGNFMTGKYHGEGKDIPLIKINSSIITTRTQQTLPSSSPSSLTSFTPSGGGGGY